MKQKILVVVSGGNVQSVFVTDPETVEVVILDEDNLGGGKRLTSVETDAALAQNSKGLVEVEFHEVEFQDVTALPTSP